MSLPEKQRSWDAGKRALTTREAEDYNPKRPTVSVASTEALMAKGQNESPTFSETCDFC